MPCLGRLAIVEGESARVHMVETEQRSTELIRQAIEALARCDSDRLENILAQFGRIFDAAAPEMHARGFDKAPFEVLTALLEISRENLTMICRSTGRGTAGLEYHPCFARTKDVAVY